ncbi:MAG TPA: hypothetical protein VK760_11835 [Candidatus Acidoferrales bacterium]|jgi:hypothetical protein|nr:hypothetical protein [Candidatus Acidoferrales bacterium]
MKRIAAVLAGIVVVETAFIVFVLTAYSQRIDRLERAVHEVSVNTSAPPARHSDALVLRF